MGEKKTDFRTWQSDYAGSLDDESANKILSYASSLAVLTFTPNKKDGGSSLISKFEGSIAFVDSNCTDLVSAEDTWLCRIDRSGYNVCYATPLIKITLSAVLNYNERLRNDLLDILWKKNNTELRRELTSRLRDEIEASIRTEEKNSAEERIKALEEEKNELRDELAQVQLQLSKANSRPSVQDYIELGSDEDGIILDSAELPTISTVPTIPPRIQAPAAPYGNIYPHFATPNMTWAQPRARYEVVRVGEIALKSPSFTEDRYFVHVSPDYRTMVIRPHPDGKVFCICNTIEIKGLNTISPFREKKELLAEYSEAYGGLLVRL